MDLWETCHQLNLLEYKWQNKMKSLPIVGPKTGFTSAVLVIILSVASIVGCNEKEETLTPEQIEQIITKTAKVSAEV